jgi:hypothetical protein
MLTPRSNIYKTAYHPDISESCKMFIRNTINAVYENDTCEYYSLSLVIETLKETTSDSDEECYLGICRSDIKELETLFIKEDVTFIELC